MREDEKIAVLMTTDLDYYKDILQWGAIIFGHNFPVTDAILIETFYYWMGKFPISKYTKVVGMFFLGFFKEFPRVSGYFEPPVFVPKQDEVKFEIDHDKPFLSESVGLTDNEFRKINITPEFRILDEVLTWIKKDYTLEQMCVLAYQAGVYFFRVKNSGSTH